MYRVNKKQGSSKRKTLISVGLITIG